MKEQKPLRLGGYVRSSCLGRRTRQEWEDGEARRQNQDIYAHAERHGHEIVRVWEEYNASAKDMDRKQLQEALAAVKNGEIDGIIVAYLSRFMRSVPAAFDAIGQIQDAGGVFIS